MFFGYAQQRGNTVGPPKLGEAPAVWQPAGMAGCRVKPLLAERAMILLQSSKHVWLDAVVSSEANTDIWSRCRVVDPGGGPFGASLNYGTVEVPVDTAAFFSTGEISGNPDPPAVGVWTAGTHTLTPVVDGSGNGGYPSIHLAANQPIRLPPMYCPAGGYWYIAGFDTQVGLNAFITWYEGIE